MNIWQRLLREHALWEFDERARARWILRECRNPLRRKSFRFADAQYRYFIHPYNHAWMNERAVEVPIIRPLLEAAAPAATLEIGNVLSHYFDREHTVLDKYEQCRYRPVINQDLLDYNTDRRFDLIVAISTFEHIGWDEDPREEEAVIRAFDKARSLLAPGGQAIITIPVGHNDHLDAKLPQLLDARLTARAMKRISADNQWVEVDLEEALGCEYGGSYYYANAVVFLTMTADSVPQTQSPPMD